MSEKDLKIEEIIHTYLNSIYGFVYRLSGNRDEANDITQDVFVKVWLNLGKYDETKNFRTWIFTIARNTTTDWLRKKKPVLFSNLDLSEEGEEFSDHLIDEELLPEELFARQELNRLLEESLSKINLDQRTVILLHLEQDLTFEEISQVVGKPTNTVKSQYRRGIMALRSILAPK